MFNLFQPRTDIHLKRVAQLLREANMARIEHQAAAEHHSALARMYSERAARLEAELREAFPNLMRAPASNPADQEQRLVETDGPISTLGARPRLSSL